MRTSSTTAVVATVVVGVAVTAIALLLGPSRISPSTDRTGDPDLSARVADHARSGHHHLGTFTIADGETTFAGLGADENTEFEIGSVTKTFTAEILANQVEAGRVSLDTTVGDLIDAGDAPVADVTLRELANHTSGLPRLGDRDVIGDILSSVTGSNPYEGVSQQDLIDQALDAELSDRGEESYSNLGPALLGQLLAIEADTTYEDLLQEQILDPLGMTSTYPMTYGSVSDNAPRGLVSTGREAEPWEMGGYIPAGGIRSTPADMALYAEHLLSDGVPDIAWSTRDDGARSHSGGTYGYSTMLIVDPDRGRAVFTVGDTSAGVADLADHLWEENS